MQTATKVKLIKRKLPSGKISLMLEYYRSGKRTFRSLKIYLTPNPKTQIDRRTNKERLEAAKEYAIKQQNLMLEKRYDVKINDTSNLNFIEFFKTSLPTNSSSDNYRSSFFHFKHFVEAKMGGQCLMEQITQDTIKAYAAYLNKAQRLNSKANNNLLSTNSKASYLGKLCLIVQNAKDRNLLYGNPLQGFKVKDWFKIEETNREFLAREEIRQLEKTNCHFGVVKRAFLFGCYTGLRHSDIRKLHWKDIKTDKDLGDYIQIRIEKTKRIANLQLIDKALEQLGGDNQEKPFLGLNKSDTHQNHILAQWILLAGITKKITFHCSRHSFAINCLLAGVDIFTLRDLLGHSTVKTTEIYAKIVEQMISKATVKLNDYWNE